MKQARAKFSKARGLARRNSIKKKGKQTGRAAKANKKLLRFGKTGAGKPLKKAGNKRAAKRGPKALKALIPPKAAKQSFAHKKFGDKRADPYFWLKNRDSSEVLNYLKAENLYAEQKLKPLKALRAALFKEMKARLAEKENQEPISIGNYLYYKTWQKQKPHPIHKRRKKPNGREEIILDENKLKTKSGYLDTANVSVSPSHNILGYGLDTQGREFYNIYFKDLKSGKPLKRFIRSSTFNFVWANDSKTVFYVRQDKKTLRPFQVYRFNIKTGKDELIFEEKDKKFFVSLAKSLCESQIIINSYSKQSSECRFLPADQPDKDGALFCARREKLRYHISYSDGFFYVLCDKDKAFNFKLMRTADKSLNEDCQKSWKNRPAYPRASWRELIPHRPDVFIEDFEAFKDFIALEIRKNGRSEIEIFDKKTKKLSQARFPGKIYSVHLIDNEEHDSPFIRLEFRSPIQPRVVYDYEPAQKKLYFKSRQTVKGGFNSKNYIALTDFAALRNGARVPISIVYKKGLKPNPSTPLLLYGYGSYGSSQDLEFSSALLSLLDRGFIYAVAHVRGGGEKGEKWHKEGKLLKKKNTFSDFIACAERLIQKSYTSPSHLYIMGGSAGGLLIGAALNKRPELFRGAVASVPFVDCLTTMLDESVPLSTEEYEEWGNPNKKTYYNYIKSYSPYDNARRIKYPHIFIQTGYHDPRVQYWEPAKWTAKLRALKQDDNALLLMTNMKSGHFGSTGRLERLKLYSLYYSFFLGIEKALL